jgi:hypothetical protein
MTWWRAPGTSILDFLGMRALYQKEKVESTYNIMNVPYYYYFLADAFPESRRSTLAFS